MRTRALADGRDQDPADLEGEHVLETTALALEVGPRVAENHLVTDAPSHLLDSAHDGREERVRDVGHNHTENARFALDQAAGEAIPDVTDLGDYGFDAPARFRAEARTVIVDHVREHHRRISGVACDIADGHFRLALTVHAVWIS